MPNTAEIVDYILEHHGVKGMRWGVRRKATVGPQEVIVSDKRKSIKTTGGEGHPAHSDAVKVRKIGQVAKKSGVKALSDKELQDYAKRIQLEQNVKRLQYNDASPPVKFVKSVLGQSGKQAVQQTANDAASQAAKKAIARAAILAAA